MTEVGEAEIIRVRDAYEAFNRGDFDAAAELIHPDIVWNWVAEVEGPFRGKGAARAHSGIKLDQRGFHLWRIEDGKAIEFRYFLDRDEALTAARA